MQIIYLTLFSVIFLCLSLKISKQLKFYDVPDGKKIHKEKIPNLGGLAFIPYIFSMLYFFDYSQKISIIFNLFLIVIIIGLIDDIKKDRKSVV